MNTKYKRFLALVLAGALMVSCLTGCGSSAQGNAADQVSAAEADALTQAATSLLRSHGSTEGKEETVYVIADANGTPTRTIVSAWLKNPEEADTITDRSTLTGIQNVKGSETYTTDANGDLVWQADGSDIYYQGDSDAPLPITASITYTLDGVDVTPELLEGASGHLVMTFHYINHTAAERVVNGKSVTLYQPFAVVSGAMLDNDKVSNVAVTNGKVINSGDQTIVVGLAMPGLKESLGLDELEDSDGNPVDIDIPESVTIEADVADFSLLTTITIAENTLLDDLDLDDVKTFDDLQDAMDELTDASTKLVDGTEELYDGVGELKDGTDELADGAKDLDDGAGDLKDGTKSLADGASDLKDGTSELADGTGDLADGASALNTGAGQLVIGLDQLQTKVSDLPDGTTKLVNGAKRIQAALKSGSASQPGIYEYLSDIESGAGSLLSGVDRLVSGANQIAGGAEGIQNGALRIEGAAGSIQSGADTIYNGAKTIAARAQSGDNSNPGIYEAAAAIQAGAKSDSSENPGIYEAASAIESGAGSVKSGLEQLPDGIADAVSTAVSTQSGDAVSALNQAAGYNQTAKSALEGIDLSELSDEDAQAVQTAIAAIGGSSQYISGVSGSLSSPDTSSIKTAVSQQLAPVLSGLDSISTAADGIKTGAQKIANGAAGIQAGAEQLAQGAQAIAAGAKSGDMSSQDKYGIYEAAAAIAQGAVSGDNSSQANYGIYEAAGAIASGAQEISSGLKSDDPGDPGLYEGIDSIKSCAQKLKQGIDTLLSDKYMGALIGGLETLQENSGTLLNGIGHLAAGAGQLFGGTSDLVKGANRLDAGAQQLDSGAGQLADGARQLDDGAGQLKDGTSKLLDGTGELTDGVSELLDGAKELMDGMAEFDEDGIQKLSDLFQDDAQDLLDRLRALQEYSREYTSYSGASDAMPSEVRFIIRTDSIGA